MSTRSVSTINTYKMHIQRMKNDKITAFTHIKDVNDYFNSKNFSISSKKNYMSAIIYYIENTKLKNKDKIIQKYKDIIAEYRKIEAETEKPRFISKREEQNYMEWDEIMNVYHNFDKNKYPRDFLQISLYILTPPRRLEDYCSLTYQLKKPKVLNDDINYYIRPPKSDHGYFIFNNYKTKKKYGTQKINVPVNLDQILVNYINDNEIITGDRIFGDIDANHFGRNLGDIYEREANKRVTANIYRHSYITNFAHNKKPSPASIDRLSIMMAHSVAQQIQYIRGGKDVI